jgi:hypothetical protein
VIEIREIAETVLKKSSLAREKQVGCKVTHGEQLKSFGYVCNNYIIPGYPFLLRETQSQQIYVFMYIRYNL